MLEWKEKFLKNKYCLSGVWFKKEGDDLKRGGQYPLPNYGMKNRIFVARYLLYLLQYHEVPFNDRVVLCGQHVGYCLVAQDCFSVVPERCLLFRQCTFHYLERIHQAIFSNGLSLCHILGQALFLWPPVHVVGVDILTPAACKLASCSLFVSPMSVFCSSIFFIGSRNHQLSCFLVSYVSKASIQAPSSFQVPHLFWWVYPILVWCLLH